MFSTEYVQSSDRPRKRHRKKAIVGIVMGVLLVMGGAVGGYFTFQDQKGDDLVLLLMMLPGLAFAIWGCGHLARHRGYPSYGAYLLFFLGLIVMVAIPATHSPFTVGFVFLFATLLPTVVLLAIPAKKAHRVHRRRKQEPDGGF